MTLQGRILEPQRRRPGHRLRSWNWVAFLSPLETKGEVFESVSNGVAAMKARMYA